MLTRAKNGDLRIISRFTRFLYYNLYFCLLFFPVLAFIIPQNGFSIPGENAICRIFSGISVYSQGSFDPGLSKTFFTFGFLYISILIVGVILTWLADLATKEECLILIENLREKLKKKKINLPFSVFFLLSGELVLILGNFGIFPKNISVGVFTGYGLSLHDMATAALSPYFEPMYHNRIGLAISGGIVILFGYITIVFIPLLFRSLRCLVVINR
ncbi:hypothetical protein HF673_11880 [Acidithiobacillus thiooxidans]|jgi:hypothetical protein|uniref:hypothetical protein n=1 Tax=Acidithiobacillus thiooxidans TaxID=930 RepID=UPI001C079217|nr:hypothetical protein [Acidithiobacillus thiooxidans]MBU2836447.1 hypothetical protein [Acidithiobacillus thiooxidans]